MSLLGLQPACHPSSQHSDRVVGQGRYLAEETATDIVLLAQQGNITGMLVLAGDTPVLRIESGVSTFQTAEQ